MALRPVGSTVFHILKSKRGEAHTAEQIAFQPPAGMAATTVQEALQEIITILSNSSTIFGAAQFYRHIQAIPAMREAGYSVAVSHDDAGMLKDVGYDLFLDDTQVVEVGKLRFDVIHNPGHTAGSVSFKVHDAPLLFTGDTLFPGGPGATHFPGSSFETIIESLDTRLFTFPGNTVVLPGHGVDTTISMERPHLAEWVARGW
jgi:glyoxylase-like metal-dependent hydrolase (beta-lactamase superfamily II)